MQSDTLTDLERAGRFPPHLQRLAFGGKVAGPNLGVDSNGPSRFDVTKLGPLLDEIHERLAGVVIKCLAWADFAGGERTLKGSPIPRQLSRFPILRDGRKAPIEIGAFLKYLKIQSAMCAMLPRKSLRS